MIKLFSWTLTGRYNLICRPISRHGYLLEMSNKYPKLLTFLKKILKKITVLLFYHLFVCPLLKVSGCGKCSVIDNKYTDYWSMADILHYTVVFIAVQYEIKYCRLYNIPMYLYTVSQCTVSGLKLYSVKCNAVKCEV